jgi:ribosomal protein L31E
MATPSMIVQIADAVTAALSAATLSQPFSAVRYYLPEFDLKEMKDLHISVVPAELDEEIADRGRDRAEYKIHVAVQKRVAKPDSSGLDNAAIDVLMQLVQEIDDLFRHKPLSGFEQALWAKTENKPIYDPKHLQEHQQFTSLLAFTFRVNR